MGYPIFRFPFNLDNFYSITGVHDFYHKMNKQAHQKFDAKFYCIPSCFYDRITIYCRQSKQCQWRMVYLAVPKEQGEKFQNSQQNTFLLKRFYLFHNHIPNIKKDLPALQLKQKPKQRQIIIYETLNQIQVNSKIMRNYWYAISGKQRLCYYPVLSFKQNSFKQWHRNAKKLNIQILSYPQCQQQSIPLFTIITSKYARKTYLERGKIVGIKVYGKPFILDSVKIYEQSEVVIFYSILPAKQEVLFMAALYPNQGTMIKSMDSNIQNQLQYSQGDQAKTSQQVNVRVSINFYKILRLFYQIMGSKVQTFIVQDQQISVDTLKCFINQVNKKKLEKGQQEALLRYVVNPTIFLRTKIPSSLFDTAIKLYSCCSEQEYLINYQIQLKKELNQEQKVGLKLINSRRFNYMVSQKNCTFLGNWRGWDLKFQFQGQLLPKMPLSLMLHKITTKFIKQETKKQWPILWHVRYKDKVQFNRVSKFYQQAEQKYRDHLYKKAFHILMRQLFKSYKLSFVFSDSFFAIKKGQTFNQYEQRILASQKNQCAHDLKIHSFNYQQCAFFSSKRQQKNAKQPQDENSNGTQKQQQKSNFLLQPLKTYITKVKRMYGASEQYQQGIGKNQEQLQCDSIFSSEILGKNEQKRYFPNSINPRYASYQQLYPIQPPSQIKDTLRYPPKIVIWEQGRFFVCILHQSKLTDHIQINDQEQRKNQKVEAQPKNIYKCSCNLHPVIGLPCRHILKICTKLKLNFEIYIDKHWLLQQSYSGYAQKIWSKKGLQVPSKGRPKDTKRNRLIKR